MKQKIFISLEKRQQIINDLRQIRMEYQKILNLLDTTSDSIPRFVT